MDALEKIATAVLYEGYVLWPYRRSARKNQQRWTFGGVYPRGFVETTQAGDAAAVEAQFLMTGASPNLDVELRCLQVVDRRVARRGPDGSLEFVDELVAGDRRILAWDEAVERRCSPGMIDVAQGQDYETVAGGVIVRCWESLSGVLNVSTESI